MEEVILKYLLKEMTIEDQHRLSKWLAEDEIHQEILKRVDAFWTNNPDRTEAIKNEVWDEKISQEISQRLNQNTTRSDHQKVKKLHPYYSVVIRKALKIAAILFIGFFLSMYVADYWKETEPDGEPVRFLEKISLNGQKINIQLPDGSRVKLNAGSRLIAPDRFIGETREVELIGEGYFEIERDESHPFIVKTNGLNVRVLGTSFNIRAYSEEQDISVAVNTGKVEVESQKPNTNLFLFPTEMAISLAC